MSIAETFPLASVLLWARSHLLVLVLGLLCGVSNIVLAENLPNSNANPAAEKWILERVASGDTADLEQRFPNQADRVISSSFVEKLLCGSVENLQVHRHGVRIIHAVVTGAVDLRNAEVPYEIWMAYCQFENRVDLSHSTFRKDLVFYGSSFEAVDFSGTKVGGTLSLLNAAFKESVNFTGVDIGGQLLADGAHFVATNQVAIFNTMKVGDSAFFRNVVFEGAVNFVGTEIGNGFNAEGIHFNNAKQSAEFNGMKVRRGADFKRAIFAGPAIFRRADIGGDIEADEAQFLASGKGADFNGLVIRDNAFFGSAIFAGDADFGSMSVGAACFTNGVFSGPVNFSHARVAFDFDASKAQFTNPLRGVDFSSMTIGGILAFTNALFAGQVNLTGTQITSQLVADDATFTSTNQLVALNGTKVGSTAFLRRAAFAGPVNFVCAEVGDSIDATGAMFTNPDQPADFTGMKIGNTLFLNKVLFAGPVRLVRSHITVNLEVSDSQFTNVTQTVDFSGIEVGGLTLVINTAFAGPLTMVSSTFDTLVIRGSLGSPMLIPHLDLSAATIKGVLEIENATVQDLAAASLSVQRLAYLINLHIVGVAHFERGNYESLLLQNVVWPTATNSIDLRGLRYQYISAGTAEEPGRVLLELVNRSIFSADVYETLETMFRREGHRDWADETYIEKRWREYRERHNCLQRIGDLFLYCTVGFGRMSWLAVVWSAVVVTIGCFVFRPNRMSSMTEEGYRRKFSPFWYSIFLFFPLTDFHTVSIWIPKKHCRRVWHWARFQRLAGWILIPLWVAAVTGIVK